MIINKKFRINLEKLERGTKKEWKTVRRGGKTFKQRFATGKKADGTKETGMIPKELLSMTAEEFDANPIEGFIHDPILDKEGVVARRHDGHTYLSDHFFTKDSETNKDLLLRHEFGHDLMGVNDYNDHFEEVLRPFEIEERRYPFQQYHNIIGGAHNPEEVIADIYSALWHPHMYNLSHGKGDDTYNLLKRVVKIAREKKLILPKNIDETLDSWHKEKVEERRAEEKSIAEHAARIAEWKRQKGKE